MKLIIQIPCFNEAETLPITLTSLPREVKGFDTVEWLVINDGSSDDTALVAKKYGVDHIVNFKKNKGLAEVFRTGIERSLQLGADVIVNTDADNQYNAVDIPKLVDPILSGKADMVIGSRPITQIKHFSIIKKILQKIGSGVVRSISHTDIIDAPSGFRAISREAAQRLNVFNDYTYTLETIIQAGMKNMSVSSVPIGVNDNLRESRLIKSLFSYIRKSISTMLRIFIVYKPYQFFIRIGCIFLLSGFALGIRFLFFYFMYSDSGHTQSVVLAGALLAIGFQTILVAFIADLLSVNRKLLEDIQYRLKRVESEKNN